MATNAGPSCLASTILFSLCAKPLRASFAMPLFDPQTIAVPSGHFIGGRLVADTARLAVLRPSDGQTHAELPLADASTVDAAVQDAWRAWRQSDWARRAPRERARVLRRWADLIEADVQHMAPLEAVCSTRPVRDAAAWDVPFTAEGLRFFAEYADKLGGEVAATRQAWWWPSPMAWWVRSRPGIFRW
jgi:aldehyde dehydrogenase (NAD+)